MGRSTAATVATPGGPSSMVLVASRSARQDLAALEESKQRHSICPARSRHQHCQLWCDCNFEVASPTCWERLHFLRPVGDGVVLAKGQRVTSPTSTFIQFALHSGTLRTLHRLLSTHFTMAGTQAPSKQVLSAPHASVAISRTQRTAVHDRSTRALLPFKAYSRGRLACVSVQKRALAAAAGSLTAADVQVCCTPMQHLEHAEVSPICCTIIAA
jgi:hypothetical protein